MLDFTEDDEDADDDDAVVEGTTRVFFMAGNWVI